MNHTFRAKTLPYLLLIGLAIILFPACGEDDSSPTLDFDRSAMLLNYADQLIIPGYTRVGFSAEGLSLAASDITENTTLANLLNAREKWLDAYQAWQTANTFNFGPAGESGVQMDLLQEIGTFPVDVDLIEANISGGLADMSEVDRDTRGFLTVEYLLYGKNESNEDVLAKLNTNENRRIYLQALLLDINNRLEGVSSGWTSFKNNFVSNNGTDAGSSASQLYNEFVRSFEAAKNFKVGLPAGKRPGQLTPEPHLVEAFYSGESLFMLESHLLNLERIYRGDDGLGLKDYLMAVEGGPDLVSLTEEQWAEVITALNNVPDDRPFADLVAEEHPSIDALHTELQRHTRFFKSDMSSLLGIAITFASGDGD